MFMMVLFCWEMCAAANEFDCKIRNICDKSVATFHILDTHRLYATCRNILQNNLRPGLCKIVLV